MAIAVLGYTGNSSGGGGTTPVGATLMKTGQTTSYRTGDDGDLEAGRATDFFTLANANPFGSTARFTDELGGTSYANDIVIDWSTYDGSEVLGWDRTLQANANWNDFIDNSLAHSIGSFTSGWRPPNVGEMFSIWDWSQVGFGLRYNYAPFNINSGCSVWTSNTRLDVTSNAVYLPNSTTIPIFNTGKTGSNRYLICRTFTVTGTTLT